MKNIYLPSSIISIGDMAFASCKNLETMEVRLRRPANVDKNTFNDTPRKRLVVPLGCKQVYETVSYWNGFSEIEEGK